MTAGNDRGLGLGIAVLAADAASLIRVLTVSRPAASMATLPIVWVRSNLPKIS
jgi:hypothetical protein